MYTSFVPLLENIWGRNFKFCKKPAFATILQMQGEDVELVGDFTGNWKEPIRAVHKGGPRYEVDVRLSQGM